MFGLTVLGCNCRRGTILLVIVVVGSFVVSIVFMVCFCIVFIVCYFGVFKISLNGVQLCSDGSMRRRLFQQDIQQNRHLVSCGRALGIHQVDVDTWVQMILITVAKGSIDTILKISMRLFQCDFMLDETVDDLVGQFFIRLFRKREIAVTTTGLNIKTHDFIRDTRRLVIQGNDVGIFHGEMMGLRPILTHYGGFRDGDPARRTEIAYMKEPQQRRDIRFV